MVYQSCIVRITNYSLKIKLSTKRSSHTILKLKCYSEKEKKSFKFTFPEGDKRILQFLAILKAEDTDQLYDKKFQVLLRGNHIYGISKIGDIKQVKYIPATPSEYGGMEVQDRMLSFVALESFIAESVRTDRPYYIEIQ